VSKPSGFVPSPFLLLRRKAARAMIFTGPLAATGFAYERCCCWGRGGQGAIGGRRRPTVKGRPGSRIVFSGRKVDHRNFKAEREPQGDRSEDDGRGDSNGTAGTQRELPCNPLLEQSGAGIDCCVLMVRRRVFGTMSHRMLRSSTTMSTSVLG